MSSESSVALDSSGPDPGLASARDDVRFGPQNWVLSRGQDTLLIIAAPLLALVLALIAVNSWGATEGATIVLLVHVVFTVAHHLPTFIRVYGDVELFRRFKWHFIFAPIIAFGIALTVALYLHASSQPLDNFLYLYIILTLWDPWHFMRQHYGFMRIYDRHNAAPRAVSARMDLTLASTWFAYIMVASGDWLLDLLQDVYTRVQWPVLLALTQEGLDFATTTLRMAALVASVAYIAYLYWCRRQGYFISTAKVLLCLVTFGVMYLTYTPNALMQALAPGWSFRVGFAVIGVVHMTQYLAIVWRYNRGLAARPGRARPGIFRWLHSRGAVWAAAGYALLCLAYGYAVTTVYRSEWLMAVLLALGFTSTMMHYYFDGFIWKVSDKQTQEALHLNLANSLAGTEASSQHKAKERTRSPSFILLKQLVYFAVPMGVLTVAALLVWRHPENSPADGDYIGHMYRAQQLSQMGLSDSAVAEARAAFEAMRWQLPLIQRRTELQPSAAREAELALLIYNESLYQNIVLPAVDGETENEPRLAAHRTRIREAIALMSRAVDSGGSLAHAGRANFNIDDAQKILASWRRQVG